MSLADIDTIVIVIMENRSFDHMLGYLNLPGSEQIPSEGLQSDPAWTAAIANVEAGVTYRPHLLAPEVQTIADPLHTQESIGLLPSRRSPHRSVTHLTILPTPRPCTKWR